MGVTESVDRAPGLWQRLRSGYRERRWVEFVIDAVLAVAFTIIGRASHAEAVDLIGIVVTAWPFLFALCLGWAVVLLTGQRASAPWPAGVVIWVVTVTSGLAVRMLSGSTAAVPFMIVTAVTLLVFLLVPRLVLGLGSGPARGRTAPREPGPGPR